MWKNFWDFILQIGSIGGLLGIIGAIYLYFERERFRANAEKEYKIAGAELAELEEERARKVGAIEELRDRIIRGSKTNEVFLMNQSSLERLEEEKWKVLSSNLNPERKVKAKVEYYEKLKNHSFLWFLRRNKKKRGPFLPKA